MTAWHADRAATPGHRRASHKRDTFGSARHHNPGRSSGGTARTGRHHSPHPWPGGLRSPLRSPPASPRGCRGSRRNPTPRRLRTVPIADDANADHVCSVFARMSGYGLVKAWYSVGFVSRGCVIAGHVVTSLLPGSLDRLPGPDFHRQAATSLRTRRNTMALGHGVTSHPAGRTENRR